MLLREESELVPVQIKKE